jgi:hypothetical protein
MDAMSDDYFTKLGKKTQPIRDAFAKPPSAPSVAKAPIAPKAPESHKAIGQLQGESLEDFTYMRGAQEKISRKLAPKSVMGKSSPKR